MRHGRILSLMLVAALILTSCTGMGTRREQPRVNLVSLQVIDMQLLEQRYGVTLRIQNPDRAELVVEGISFELELNDREFAYGVSRQGVTIPGFGESLLQVEMSSTLFNVVDQLRDLERRQEGTLSYRIHGKIALGGSLLSLPFEKSGVLGEPFNNAPSASGSSADESSAPRQ